MGGEMETFNISEGKVTPGPKISLPYKKDETPYVFQKSGDSEGRLGGYMQFTGEGKTFVTKESNFHDKKPAGRETIDLPFPNFIVPSGGLTLNTEKGEGLSLPAGTRLSKVGDSGTFQVAEGEHAGKIVTASENQFGKFIE